MTDVRLCFVAPAGGSAFMLELLEVVADAVVGAGGMASVHVGAPFPRFDEPCAFVVIPHEYFALTPAADHPDARLRSRTIALCVEHPGNATFEATALRAANLGAAVAITHDSVSELRRRGIAAERFQLGYSRLWDVWNGDATRRRPVDIAYLGTTDARRDSLLAHQADDLSEWECRLLIPPHEMMTEPRPDFLTGPDKLALLADTKVLLNLHRGGSRSFEWVRALEAMCNGCVVVSERSTDFEPLVPGEHMLLAAPARSVATAAALLRNPRLLESLRREAYSAVRSLNMLHSAAVLTEIAAALPGQGAPPSRPAAPPGSAGPPRSTDFEPEPPPPPTGLPELADWARAMPVSVRSAVLSTLDALTATGPGVSIRVFPPTAPASRRVSALVPVVDDPTCSVDATLRSLADQRRWSVEAFVGRLEGRLPAAPEGLRWGRGSILNALAARSSADLLLVIEPGQELYPTAVQRLVARMDESGCAMTYGMVADLASKTLWNALPWEPARLARRVYVGPPFLIRRDTLSELGGFAEDAVLDGYEYHELLRRLADRGASAALVPQVVGRGRPVRPAAVSAAWLDPERVRRRLAEHLAAQPDT